MDTINKDMKDAEKHLTQLEKCCCFTCPWNKVPPHEDVGAYGESYRGDSYIKAWIKTMRWHHFPVLASFSFSLRVILSSNYIWLKWWCNKRSANINRRRSDAKLQSNWGISWSTNSTNSKDCRRWKRRRNGTKSGTGNPLIVVSVPNLAQIYP